MFTIRVGVSAWYTVNTSVIYLRECTWDGCLCIFRMFDYSLGVCEPIHLCFSVQFFFPFRCDVDQYCYKSTLTVYLQFCLVGSSLPLLYVLKTHSRFGRQISATRVGME